MTYLISARHKDGKKNVYACEADDANSAREIALKDIPTLYVALALIRGGK